MNLREFCGIEGFETAILTTYQLDPLFFERVVLRDLIASGVRRVILLADGPQTSPAIEAVSDQLVDLGRRYQMYQAWTRGAFHAKLCVKLSPKGAVVACGSTNLTYPGWLGVRSEDSTVGNREVSGAWRVQPGAPQAADLALALRSVMERLSDSSRHAVEQVAFNGWLSEIGAPPEGRLLVSSTGQSLSSQLASRWQGRKFHRMWMATGSTDQAGAMLGWASRTFGVQEAVVEVDPQSAVFDPALLQKLPLQIRIRVRPPQPRTHLKVAVFEGNEGLAAVYGSANCSAAAWLLAPDQGGNTEAVVVLDAPDRDSLTGVLQLDSLGAVSPKEIAFASPPEQERAFTHDEPSLSYASFVRSTGQLSCAFQPPVQDGASVRLTINELESEATPNSRGIWIAKFETLPDRHRTRFVTATVAGSSRTSCRGWIEDVESLEAMRARTVDIGAVANLGGGSGASDPGQTLRGISKLSHWLLGDWAHDEDPIVSPKEEESTDPERPAAPVTPEQIFKSLDDLKAKPDSLMNQMAGGGVSLAGIMRLVFGDPVSQLTDSAEDVVATELRDDKGKGSNSPPDEDDSDDKTEQDAAPQITAADRTRLIGQMRRFVDSMANPEFADRCTARQLQQAVAFPLASSLIAAHGDWIQTAEDHTGWLTIIRRVCELLLLKQQGDPKQPTESVTMIERVCERYSCDDRFDEFDAIIGDGTLWVLLLAVATGLGVETDLFERDLLLVDVLNFAPFRSQRSAVQLAELCALANFQDRTREWIDAARSAARRVTDHQSRLEQLADTLPIRAQGQPQVGDWLWNSGAGFARIEELEDSNTGAVHIRKLAQTRPNVKLRYYVNLRLSGFHSADPTAV